MDIRALARHLDLSIGTVSRALNGRKDVRETTRVRVLEAVAALGYVPNHSGQTLRRGQTRTVAFVLTPSADSAAQGDPFFMALFGGIQAALATRQLDLMVLLARSDEDQFAFLQRAVSRGLADGWLLSATMRHDPRIPFLLERKVPFATLGRSLSGGSQPWIDLDFEAVAHQSVARLAAAGHRRIALADPASDINLGHVFADAYRAALEKAGLSADPSLLVRVETDESGGYEAVDTLLGLTDPPTALILNGETMPVGAYRRLHEAGKRPGRDMSLIGVRETPASRGLSPSFTCFTLSLHDLGRDLAEALLLAMTPDDDGLSAPPVQRLWPMTLVEGTSDGFGQS
ncbi:MAG: substrate-binding domain-containing protein [Janthinobacterium lividum]